MKLKEYLEKHLNQQWPDAGSVKSLAKICWAQNELITQLFNGYGTTDVEGFEYYDRCNLAKSTYEQTLKDCGITP